MTLDSDEIRNFGITDYLGREIPCQCGRKHSVAIEKIVIGNGALRTIPEILTGFNCKKVFVVADGNTYKAAGESVAQLLKDGGFLYKTLVYEREDDLIPNEAAIGEFLVNMDQGTDIIVAVGSGVINDLAKYVGSKLDIPTIIVATAPSMDGFASDTSALILDNLKTSVEVQTVKAIIGDVDILKAAPLAMILAGLGDMLGKYPALRDWQLGKIITGEYYCETICEMVKLSVQKCIDQIHGLNQRDDLAIKNLMEGLVISGIAMSFVGNSRPASGSEHHLSHYWETMFLIEGKKAVLHGTKVGITALASNKIGEILASKKIDFGAAARKAAIFNEDQWQEDVLKLYQKAARGILKQSASLNRNSLEERSHRVDIIKSNWEKIVSILQAGPSAEQLKNILQKAGAPIHPRDIGVDDHIVHDSIRYAKEIRTRYTVLQLLWDLSLSEEYANDIQEYYRQLQ